MRAYHTHPTRGFQVSCGLQVGCVPEGTHAVFLSYLAPLSNQTKGRLNPVFRRPLTYHVQCFPVRPSKRSNHTHESFKPACKSYFIRLTASVFWIFILCRVCGICTISPLGGRRKIFQQRVMFISINRRTNCNLHSNAKGRLKNPLRNFSDGLSFRYRLSNQSSPTSIVFSL